MMTKPNKQVIIDILEQKIATGKSYGTCLGLSKTKWDLPRSTFARYWKTANQQHAQKQQAIKKELAKVDIQGAITARKKAIMTADQRKEVLTIIASGKLKLSKWWIGKDYQVNKKVVPNYSERISAIAELNKMEGDYAPTKIAPTDSNGEDINLRDIKDISTSKLFEYLLFLETVK